MAYTYQFEDHLREHRPSRLGQRLWWLPVAAAVGMVIADVVYLAATHSGHRSAALALALPLVAALLLLVAWAALSIADWTYPAEKHYREAQHAAARRAHAYILAGRRSRDERPPPGKDHRTAGGDGEARGSLTEKGTSVAFPGVAPDAGSEHARGSDAAVEHPVGAT